MLYQLDNRDDPEVDASIKAFMKAQFSSGKVAPATTEASGELAAQIEKKYAAAQVVDFGIQVRRQRSCMGAIGVWRVWGWLGREGMHWGMQARARREHAHTRAGVACVGLPQRVFGGLSVLRAEHLHPPVVWEGRRAC